MPETATITGDAHPGASGPSLQGCDLWDAGCDDGQTGHRGNITIRTEPSSKSITLVTHEAPRPIPAQPGWAAISAVHWVNPSTPPRRAGPSQRKGSSTAKSSNDPGSQEVKLSRVTRRSTRI